MKKPLLLLTLTLGLASFILAADSPVDTSSAADVTTAVDPNAGAPAPAPVPDSSHPAVASSSEGVLSRWLEITDFSFALRYRSAFDADGVHTIDQGQQKSLLSGKLKLDREGKYSIGFRFSSGEYFTWSYADFIGGGATQANLKSIPRLAALSDQQDALAAGPSGWSYASGGWAFTPRELYLSAKPLNGFEFQYGSLGINRGMNSEITSYDDDGYLAGVRMIVRQPQHLYFDEISVTYGDLGYIYTPDFFQRLQGMEHFTYHQFLVRKKINTWLEASADYTYQIAHTVREAAKVSTKRFHFADSVRVEGYERVNNITLPDASDGGDFYPSGNGWSVTAEKTFAKRVNIQAGYADIDYNYDVYSNSGANAIWGYALNGDIYSMGKRPFVRANVKLNSYLNLFGFYTHLVDFNYARDGFVWNSQALYSGVQVDFKSLLKTAHWL